MGETSWILERANVNHQFPACSQTSECAPKEPLPEPHLYLLWSLQSKSQDN